MRGSSQTVADRGADSVSRDRRYRDRRPVARVGAVERVEQPRRCRDEVARRRQRVVARHLAEADQPLAGARFGGVEAERLARRVVRGELAGRDDAASTQFNTTAAGAVILTVLVLPGWTTPPTANWLPMVLIGVAGTVGHFLLVMAFSRAPASLLSPFLYSQVAGAALISVFVFGDPLHPATLAGALVLVASGVAIWWRENRGRVAELAAGRGGPQPPHGK